MRDKSHKQGNFFDFEHVNQNQDMKCFIVSLITLAIIDFNEGIT